LWISRSAIRALKTIFNADGFKIIKLLSIPKSYKFGEKK
jgi:hypothetical protein